VEHLAISNNLKEHLEPH
jgi:hypothetical protein